jgi:hypothetical protein
MFGADAGELKERREWGWSAVIRCRRSIRGAVVRNSIVLVYVVRSLDASDVEMFHPKIRSIR